MVACVGLVGRPWKRNSKNAKSPQVTLRKILRVVVITVDTHHSLLAPTGHGLAVDSLTRSWERLPPRVCTRGAAERAIRAVNDALVSVLASFGFAERHWSDWLPYVTLVLNSTPTERLGGATPAAVMGRREIAMTDLVGRARALTTDTGPPTPLTPEQFADMAKQAHAKLDAVERAALETSVARRNAAHAARMAKSHVVLTSDDIDVGDFVLVSTDGFPTTSTSKLEAKLSTHWTGPFIAVALERPYVWRVRQLGGTAEYCLHLKYLRPYRPPTARRPWRRS